MREPPDYDAIERNLWKQNAAAVSDCLENFERNLVNKIQTFIWRFGFSEEEVRKKINEDAMFAAHFAKEPRRTGFHEHVAADWLKEEKHISDFRILPKSGAEAYYVTRDGEIRKGMRNPPSKSLDFYWQTGNTEFFVAHKYTKEGGGNQDSQFKEMRDLLHHFQGSAEKDRVLLIIVDGPYYTSQKMSDLQRFLRSHPPRSYACPIEHVPDIIAEYVSPIAIR